MAKLLCPHCLKSVAMPDAAAGTDAPCPECGKTFPIPARYTPVVAPAAATPLPSAPFVPPPPAPHTPEPLPSGPLPIPYPDHAAPRPLPAGYTHSRTLTVSPIAVAWTPAVALSVIVLLTFAPWVGVYPGGTAVYTAGAWRTATGFPKRNPQLERLLLRELPPPSVEERTHSDWLVMAPYLITLILAAAWAWVERLEAQQRLTAAPRRFALFWPHRQAIAAVLTALATLFLFIETTRGFGLERGLEAAVAAKYEEARQATAADPTTLQAIEFDQAQELARDGLERTAWFVLVWCLHIAALLALAGRAWLDRRGNKLPPRLVFQY